MLRTLRNRDPKEVEALLASITLSLLPHPDLETHHSINASDATERELVLAEVLRRLNLEASDNSPEAKAKIYKLLAEELSNVALSQANLKQLKTETGQRGELRSDLYETKITNTFRTGAADTGIRPNHVESVLSAPDLVEHLLPEKFGSSVDEPLSLYVKRLDPNRKGDTFSLLVLCKRKGFQQAVVDCLHEKEPRVIVNVLTRTSQ